MPKSKWVETLKTVRTATAGYADSVYTKKAHSLSNVGLEDEPAENADEWTFMKEVYGKESEVIHDMELRHEGGIAASLRGKLDMSRCYHTRMALKRPHIVLDTSHALCEIFPSQIQLGIGGHVMNFLGFDRFFLSRETGCSVFDMFMIDARLDQKSYAGNYGGRRGLLPLYAHSTLKVTDTPEWIWTPEPR